MKKNYFKSYFKSFGFLATITVILLFAVAGLGLFYYDIVKNETYVSIVSAAILVVLGGGALVGFSGLRNRKVCMTDFIRITFFVGSIALGVFTLLSEKYGNQMVPYFCVAGVYLVEIIIRCFAIKEDANDLGMKAYFGAIGYRYNPLVLVIVSSVLAAVIAIMARAGLLEQLSLLSSENLEYFAFGGGSALLIILFVSGMDKENDASILDCVLVVAFLTALYLPIVLYGYLTQTLIKICLLVDVFLLIAVLSRAVFYNKDAVYDTNRHKSNTYYRCVFGKYSILFAIICAIVLVFLTTLAVLYADGSCILYHDFYKFLKVIPLENNLLVMIFAGSAIGIVAILALLLLVFRKFKSTEPEKVDWILVTLLVTTAIAIAILVSITGDAFALFQSNVILLVLLIVYIVIFLLSAFLQIIRIRNFDSMAAIIAAEAEQRMREKKEAKEAAKAAAAEAEKNQEEEKPYDPFALTEEDEAIYAAQYGEEQKPKEPEGNPYVEEEEEPQEEEVVYEEEPQEEEVVYEEVSEDESNGYDEFDDFLNSIPEKQVEQEEPQEEEVVYEEVPAEEVQEQPAPVHQEEATSDDDDDDSEEDDDTDDDDDAEEEAEEGEEPIVHEESHAKEAAIEIQEYVAVDEEGKPKKIKRKFNTKMMFAPYETKEYYNEIKNYLMMYRAKGRYSARCESFRYKGLVAKLALGGKAIKVFLALDKSLIEQYPKYHLKDVSEKRQYAEVPVMIKVRSDRSLKYCKELIDLMFANRLVKPKRNFEPTNFVPQLIPNGEAILGNLGMETYYLQSTMNVNGIPEEMPTDLVEYLPMIPGDELDGPEEEASVYLDTLCNHFNEGDEVTLEALKALHLCQKGNVLRVRARGTLDRKLIIYAEKFDEDALQMIMCTNGTAVRIIR